MTRSNWQTRVAPRNHRVNSNQVGLIQQESLADMRSRLSTRTLIYWAMECWAIKQLAKRNPHLMFILWTIATRWWCTMERSGIKPLRWSKLYRLKSTIQTRCYPKETRSFSILRLSTRCHHTCIKSTLKQEYLRLGCLATGTTQLWTTILTLWSNKLSLNQIKVHWVRPTSNISHTHTNKVLMDNLSQLDSAKRGIIKQVKRVQLAQPCSLVIVTMTMLIHHPN